MDVKQQIAEIAKCKRDPIYFMETYCRVQNPIHGLVPFKLYDFQKQIIRDFLSNRFIIINKSRQVGLSTLTSNYALWLALFHTNKSIIILSIKEEDAKEFLKKIKVSFEGLPEWLREEPVVSNVHTLQLTSGSVISSVSSGSSAARGRTPSLLIIDEAAFIQNMEDIWTSSWPSLSRGGAAILISTPNGQANMFYQLWRDADPDLPPDRRNSFHRIFVHWTQVPDYRGFDPEPGMAFEEIVERAKQNEWYKKMRPQFDARRWAQEFEGDFLGSGNTVVPGEKLKLLETRIKQPKAKFVFTPDQQGGVNITAADDGYIWVWEFPKEGQQYLISADISSGAGSDYSAIYVINMLTNNIAAEVQCKLNTMTMAYALAELGHWYNTALIVPEITGIGWGTTQKLVFEIGYPNVFRRIDPQKPTKSKKDVWGWQTTPKTRPVLISAIIEYFDGDNEFISKRLWQELTAFVWKSADKAEAESGHHDDLVMAFAIGQYARKLQLMRQPLTVPILQQDNNTDSNGTPLPFITSNDEYYDSEDDIRKWLLS